MAQSLDSLAVGDAVRYLHDDGDHMDGIVVGLRDGSRCLGTAASPGYDEDCVVVEFLVVEMTIGAVVLACAPERLIQMRDAELREFLRANLASVSATAGAPTRA